MAFTIGSVTVSGDFVTVSEQNITYSFNSLTGDHTEN